MSATPLNKLIRISSIAKEFALTLIGKSYFHEQPKEGKFWENGGSYYYDFTPKLAWRGKRIDGLPALLDLESKKLYVFPINALQYGLGAIDAGDKFAISIVEDWLVGVLKKNNGCIPISFDGLNQQDVFSTNSAMAIGHALSFITRSNSLKLEPYVCKLLSAITTNVEQGGCSIDSNFGIILLEVCYKKPVIVVNGWIFALFGLIDYSEKFKDPQSMWAVEASLDALEIMAPEFIMANNWSYYDNNSRINSPNYHQLHIVLFGILSRKYPKRNIFTKIYVRLKDGYSLTNRCKFTTLKIQQKLFEIASL
jgi:heparosan-N-sulfate-glucuronate 5-epimerase